MLTTGVCYFCCLRRSQTRTWKSKHLFLNPGVSASLGLMPLAPSLSAPGPGVCGLGTGMGVRFVSVSQPFTPRKRRAAGFLWRLPRQKASLGGVPFHTWGVAPQGTGRQQTGRKTSLDPVGVPSCSAGGVGSSQGGRAGAGQGVSGWREPEQMWVKRTQFNLAKEVPDPSLR